LRRSRVIGVVCAAALLLTAGRALASFASGASASLRVATAVLDAPTSPAAAVDTCTAGVSADVTITWTASASAAADGYVILRSDGGGSPSEVGTVSGHDTTSFTDTGLAFATDYSYTVEATRASWTSDPSSSADVTTPAADCS
jgi:hypothetical protein